MTKFMCKNCLCKHHCGDIDDEVGCTLNVVHITGAAECKEFEKGFNYYFYHYMQMRSKIITYPELEMDPDMRYSIYYLMKCLPIVLGGSETRGFITLNRKDGDHEILSSDDISKMIKDGLIDHKKLRECISDFVDNGLPKPKPKEQPKKEYQEYGWLSPSGDFYEGPFGAHEEVALETCEELGLVIPRGKTARDFLTNQGWVLVHDPTGMGEYIVSYAPGVRLTKRQKDFLYEYFYDMGMKSRAELYIKEEY